MIRVACPKCAKPLGLPDTVAGKPVKCPSCQQAFIAPTKTGAAPARPARAAAAKPEDDYDNPTPYGLKQEVELPQLAKNAQSEAVDEMVVTARRQRKRNKAWEYVGMPAKFIKRAALSAVIFWLVLYLFLTVIIVLANHNMEQIEKGAPVLTRGGSPDLPKYLFIQDVVSGLSPQHVRPIIFWLVITGGFIAAMVIYGLQLAGAECMKKLENYPLAVFSMIVGTLSLNLFGIWGLLTMLDKNVQYEFRVSKRRAQGFTGEDLYREDDDEEDEEGEEVEDEEEEAPQPARTRK
jgi:hypothetical protein